MSTHRSSASTEEMRRLVAEGLSHRQIGKRLGVHSGTVGRRLQQAAGDPDGDPTIWLRRRAAELEAQVKRLRLEKAEGVELLDAVATAVTKVAPVPPYKPQSRKRGKPVFADVVLLLGDWHIGETFREEDIEGFGGYSWDVAKGRLARLTTDLVRWVEAQRGAYQIDRCVVIVLGDLITGLIHQDLLLAAEFPVPEQIARAGYALATVLFELSHHFKAVEVHTISADNHSRLFKKPLATGKVGWSLARVVHTIAETACEPCEKVTFHHIPGVRGVVKAGPRGYRFLCEHGDAVRAYLNPVRGAELLQNREAKRRMGRPAEYQFDYHVIGHYHTPGFYGITIFNGALCGTTPLDHQATRDALPCQMAFLVGPHGPFGFVPFDLSEAGR